AGHSRSPFLYCRAHRTGPASILSERTRSLHRMRLRIAAVSGACCALLAGNSLCSAAEPPPPAPAKSPSPTVSHPPAAIGGMIGGAQIFADGDYSNERLSNGDFGSRDSKPRFAFAANF